MIAAHRAARSECGRTASPTPGTASDLLLSPGSAGFGAADAATAPSHPLAHGGEPPTDTGTRARPSVNSGEFTNEEPLPSLLQQRLEKSRVSDPELSAPAAADHYRLTHNGTRPHHDPVTFAGRNIDRHLLRAPWRLRPRSWRRGHRRYNAPLAASLLRLTVGRPPTGTMTSEPEPTIRPPDRPVRRSLIPGISATLRGFPHYRRSAEKPPPHPRHHTHPDLDLHHGVLIAPARGTNTTFSTMTVLYLWCPHRPCEGYQRVLLGGGPEAGEASSSPLRGVPTCRRRVRWPPPGPSSSPLRGVPTRLDGEDAPQTAPVLIAPARGTNRPSRGCRQTSPCSPHRPCEGYQPERPDHRLRAGAAGPHRPCEGYQHHSGLESHLDVEQSSSPLRGVPTRASSRSAWTARWSSSPLRGVPTRVRARWRCRPAGSSSPLRGVPTG